ncbi:MFS transporter [Nocardioides lijunqiniae]|uniref:MFS transporter n=1 Tax=Nocardioides lijunqiniae TaxID=2760832 RepID=UPI0018784016|nr:MFS transporter [Nocardioides lijunqiniae]
MSTTSRSALAEPTEAVPRIWVLWLSLASIGVWAGFFGPIQVLLAQQAELVNEAEKESVLALVTGAGAAVSLVFNPLWGALSDRTVLRIGRRVPWVVGGAVTGAVSMLVLAPADTLWQMLVGWCLAQASLNAMLAALTATIPDQVPVRERGTVGGWLALAQTVGVIAGSGIAAATGSIAAGYLTSAGLLLLTALPYALRSRDVPLRPQERAPFALGPFVRSFWVSPRLHPDFAWAWLTRFLVNLGNSLVVLYLLYYLDDAVGLTEDQAESRVFQLTAAYGVLTVLTAVAGGIWSDRVARRKPFVIASGLVIAAALLVLAVVPTMTGAWVGAVVLGIGFGIYSSVDFAMISQVLPSAGDRAKDLGVINIANALPQVVAPVVAALILGLDLGYATLYTFAAATTVVGSLLVTRIRSVA